MAVRLTVGSIRIEHILRGFVSVDAMVSLAVLSLWLFFSADLS
jgi:hypothetical protein